MRIRCWLVIVGVTGVHLVSGQVKRQFNVEDTETCESVKLVIKANSGNCYIRPSQNTDILNVYSNQDASSFSHNFVKEIKGKVCEVNLSLEEVKSDGFGQTISARTPGGAALKM